MKRVLTVLTLTALVVTAMASAAMAAWLAAGSGNASSSAASVQAGNTPATAVSGDDVTVSWSASTLSNGTAVDGYAVKRYSSGGALQSIGASCSGTIAGLSCTENDVPAGTWKYTVTPKHAGWTGAESAMSAPITIAGADTDAPAVTLTAPSHNSFTNDTTPDLSGAAGNATGDGTTVTVKIYSGTGTAGAVVQTLTPTRTGAAWSTTAATLAQGTYTAQATQADAAGNTGTSSANTFTVDTTAPSASAITTTNGGTATKPDAGDTVAYTFNEPMKASSILTGWSGSSSTTVTVTIVDTPASGDDVLTVDGTNLGSLDLKLPDYVSGGNVTFTSSSMEQSGNSIVVTLGTPCTASPGVCGGGVVNTAPSVKGKINWTPSSSATDRAGNACTTTVVIGANVRNF